jgi:hypothetical protein
MNRITEKQLECAVNAINQLTKSPLETYSPTKGSRVAPKYESNIGNYHLSYAYGGVSLHRIMNKNGGVDDIFRCGHISKRELWNRMQSYICGLTLEK